MQRPEGVNPKRSICLITAQDAGAAGTAADEIHPDRFFPFLATHLRARALDVVGLSSICSSYPLTLRLAEEIKRLNPRAFVIIGGPQASVVDVATMRAFSCVDVVVRGEATRS